MKWTLIAHCSKKAHDLRATSILDQRDAYKSSSSTARSLCVTTALVSWLLMTNKKSIEAAYFYCEKCVQKKYQWQCMIVWTCPRTKHGSDASNTKVHFNIKYHDIFRIFFCVGLCLLNIYSTFIQSTMRSTAYVNVQNFKFRSWHPPVVEYI